MPARKAPLFPLFPPPPKPRRKRRQSPTEKLKDDINSRVKRALDSNGIEIPYNYITITSPPEKAANNKGGETL